MPFREMTRDQVWLLPPTLDELNPPIIPPASWPSS